MTSSRVDHKVPLTDGWSLWRTVALRGAGMPFSWVENLHDDRARPDGVHPGVTEVIRQPLFHSALVWQAPDIVRNWLGPYSEALSRHGDAPLRHKKAQREAVVAQYVQRYSTKNETIGFFGSLGWVRLGEGHESGLRRSGTAGVRRAEVFFEVWAITALADSWRREPQVLPHLPVRLTAATSWASGVLRRPYRTPGVVGNLTTALLTCVDGRRNVAEVLDRARLADGSVPDSEALAQELRRLLDDGILTAGFAVPIDAYPERSLRAQVSALADVSLRDRLTTELDRLEAARAAVFEAMGAPEALLRAKDDLAALFEELTGRRASVTKHESSRARTLVYHDCRRDLDAVVGGDLLDALRAPLGLLLDSTRWFVSELARDADRELLELYEELARNGEVVTLDRLFLAAGDVLNGAPGTAVHRVQADFRARWEEVLSEAVDGHTTSEAIAPLVRALFPRGRHPWAAAVHHSPDVMLARTDLGYQWVLGELHVALNTLESRVFFTLSDSPESLHDAVAADLPGERIAPLYPIESPIVTSRTYPPLASHVPDRYRYWSYGADHGHPTAGAGLPATALWVRKVEDRLCAGPWDGSWHAPLTEFFGEFLSAIAVNCFDLPRRWPHASRLTIDDMVVQRESWRFPAGELPDGRRRGELTEFLRRRGLPRRLFAKSSAQAKPFYVDLESSLLMRQLERVLSRLQTSGNGHAEWVQLTEMVPGPDQLWLTDEAGERYTCEFRLVAVDEHAGAADADATTAGFRLTEDEKAQDR